MGVPWHGLAAGAELPVLQQLDCYQAWSQLSYNHRDVTLQGGPEGAVSSALPKNLNNCSEIQTWPSASVRGTNSLYSSLNCFSPLKVLMLVGLFDVMVLQEMIVHHSYFGWFYDKFSLSGYKTPRSVSLYLKILLCTILIPLILWEIWSCTCVHSIPILFLYSMINH